MTTAVVDRGRGEVAFVLLMIQGLAGLLGALGMVVLSGALFYAVVPVLGSAFQFVLAGFVVRGRHWALWTMVAAECVFLVAFGLNGVIGLAPQVDVTVTMTGVLTRMLLPAALIYLGIRELFR